MNRTQRLVRAAVGAAALTATVAACTPEQRAAWLEWHANDPQAAVAFAQSLPPREEPPAETAFQSRYGMAVWDRIARCESGGRWDYPPVTNRTGTYSGGLMIGHRWWPAFGGREFAAQPYLATKQQQIIVAERIADANGLDRGWQCY